MRTPREEQEDWLELVQPYVIARLSKEAQEHGAAARISKATGFASAHLSNILGGKRRPGDRIVSALASHWGLSPEQLKAEAVAWNEARPSRVAEYPTRAVAARLCREHGVQDAVVDRVLDEPVDPADRERSVLWWADRIRIRAIQVLESSVEEKT